MQRRLLRAEELDEFDRQWGLDPEGDFVAQEGIWSCCGVGCGVGGEVTADAVMKRELRLVYEEAKKREKRLKLATDAHTGIEILHSFILDLLGKDSHAAQIFQEKAEEDYKHTRVVTRTTKALCVTLIVFANLFCLYYSLLKGYSRGIQWQQAFLFGALSQIIAEIVLFESMECLWINFMVSELVSSAFRWNI